jgi:hypothetical protein
MWRQRLSPGRPDIQRFPFRGVPSLSGNRYARSTETVGGPASSLRRHLAPCFPQPQVASGLTQPLNTFASLRANRLPCPARPSCSHGLRAHAEVSRTHLRRIFCIVSAWPMSAARAFRSRAASGSKPIASRARLDTCQASLTSAPMKPAPEINPSITSQVRTGMPPKEERDAPVRPVRGKPVRGAGAGAAEDSVTSSDGYRTDPSGPTTRSPAADPGSTAPEPAAAPRVAHACRCPSG